MSPELNLNLSEATSFELQEEGPYHAQIEKYTVKTSKTKQEQMLFVIFRCTDEPYTNVRFSRNYMLEGAGAGFTSEFLKVCGIEADWENPEWTFDPDDIVGTDVTVVNTHQDDQNGKPQNNVAQVLAR
jgi:hypothetical protein